MTTRGGTSRDVQDLGSDPGRSRSRPDVPQRGGICSEVRGGRAAAGAHHEVSFEDPFFFRIQGEVQSGREEVVDVAGW